MNMCPLDEKESPARIGAKPYPTSSAELSVEKSEWLWVCIDNDFVLPSVFVTIHRTAEGARARMLVAARGYLDQPDYCWGDMDDESGKQIHWEDHFWMKDICSVLIRRRRIEP